MNKMKKGGRGKNCIFFIKCMCHTQVVWKLYAINGNFYENVMEVLSFDFWKKEW